jgi:hypothetical protein
MFPFVSLSDQVTSFHLGFTVLVRTLASSLMGRFFNLFRHLAGLLWTSDQPVAKASARQHNTERRGQTSVLYANPRSERSSDQGLRLKTAPMGLLARSLTIKRQKHYVYTSGAKKMFEPTRDELA